jgi:hypothetical protein
MSSLLGYDAVPSGGSPRLEEMHFHHQASRGPTRIAVRDEVPDPGM